MIARILLVSAFLSTLSIALYAFTGLHLWAPTLDDEGRQALVTLVHAAPIVAYLLSKL